MIILGIETSCDETALSLIEASGGLKEPYFELLGFTLFSQIDIHKEYGGVFPAVAKREHAKKLVPLLKNLLTPSPISSQREEIGLREKVEGLLSREYELYKEFIEYIPSIEKPNIDAIAVTYGPGLEPALWVGVNFAKALGLYWNIPVIPTNHMEGHIISPLLHHTPYSTFLQKGEGGAGVTFPALALLISGGHTELVLVKSWGNYEIIGKTRDDAVGEAFDKVARILGLPYPGGPEISKLAHEARINKYQKKYILPRPMIHSRDFDFSFSGLKTAVLYLVRDTPPQNHKEKCVLAREFEDAATDVLILKTKKAIEQYSIESLISGGGVIANGHIRNSLQTLAQASKIHFFVPEISLSTDNATMIGMAGYIAYLHGHHVSRKDFIANGNLSF